MLRPDINIEERLRQMFGSNWKAEGKTILDLNSRDDLRLKPFRKSVAQGVEYISSKWNMGSTEINLEKNLMKEGFSSEQAKEIIHNLRNLTPAESEVVATKALQRAGLSNTISVAEVADGMDNGKLATFTEVRSYKNARVSGGTMKTLSETLAEEMANEAVTKTVATSPLFRDVMGTVAQKLSRTGEVVDWVVSKTPTGVMKGAEVAGEVLSAIGTAMVAYDFYRYSLGETSKDDTKYSDIEKDASKLFDGSWDSKTFCSKDGLTPSIQSKIIQIESNLRKSEALDQGPVTLTYPKQMSTGLYSTTLHKSDSEKENTAEAATIRASQR